MSRAVIKLGGSVLVDDKLRAQLLAQIAELKRTGNALVIVHGGGKQIAALLKQLNIESRFHDGLRVTDAAARDAVQMMLAGKIGKDLVAEFAQNGLPAVSLTGGDGLSFLAEKALAEDGTDLGFVGRITHTSDRLITALLNAEMLPVVACVALGSADFAYYNINGDQMAAAVAGGCHAETLVFVTDVGGVLDGAGQPIAELQRAQINELLVSGVASGGMRPKLRACLEALDAGVKRILIVGAATENVLPRAFADEANLGTCIREIREYLFVCGTLRSAFAPDQVKPLLERMKLVSGATVRGRLYDLGEYPGAVLAESGGAIVGELLELPADETLLQALDHYEGIAANAPSNGLFVRTRCHAALPDGRSVEAWIYVYNQPLDAARLIVSGDYAEVAARPLQSEISN